MENYFNNCALDVKKVKENKGESQVESYNYKYFTKKKERHDVYEFSKELSNYLHSENIPNIVFMDRSSRQAWVGLDEYWKNNFSKDKKPNMYFINPDGFIIDSYCDQEDTEEQEENIKNQFENIYKKLNDDKDKPLAIFDTCIHTGSTIAPVIHFFERNGYSDLRVVIANTNSDYSDVYIDKNLDDNAKRISCYPFSLGKNSSGVTKHDDYVVSSYNDVSERDLVVKSRKEIRQIVRNEGI